MLIEGFIDTVRPSRNYSEDSVGRESVHPDQLDQLVRQLRIQRNDDARCEVKACTSDLGSAVWDSVSAFANTSGGMLLLGLDQESGFAPAPGFNLDRVRDQFVDGIGDGGSPGRLVKPPSYAIERGEVDGAPVLLVEVAENDLGSKPCYVRAKGVQGGSFKRVDDKDIKLSASEIFEMQVALTSQDTDRRPVSEAEIDDLDDALVEALLDRRKGSKALRGAKGRAEQLSRLNVTTKDGIVRLAGLLVVGRYPQQFLPRLLIDVTVHPANEKSAPGEPVRFIDREQCEGPLAEAIDQAVSVTARNLRTYSTVEGTARVDHLEIPREVLREAIANAAVHREYHQLFQGQPVTVDVYPNRVVVTNPGGLWGGKTLESLDDGISRCRNQTLMQLLQSVPVADTAGVTVEGQGGGIKMMIHEMEAHALDRPRFRISPDQVVVELRRHGAEIPALRAWLGGLSTDPLSDYDDAALLVAKREGKVGVTDLRDLLRLDSDDIRQLLSDLSNRGLLRFIGGESYELWSDEPRLRTSDEQVIAALSAESPLDIHELSAAVGKSPNTLRPILRRLIGDGHVTPTAPATSRSRKYLRTR
ncbi:ATP-binding protein [Microlunatus parietis]|uniref:ATP-dependent DNA helicase RecG n=1 Tax=Microlunatus parietis TaxID=682979 RepID=A0A7Y9I8L4_9ACTN|nr:ATP-binding protein [Microlunatus parietis]NYE72356.1 ATP-dependent DNA helicase RecG [Microlunatus parietis]